MVNFYRADWLILPHHLENGKYWRFLHVSFEMEIPLKQNWHEADGYAINRFIVCVEQEKKFDDLMAMGWDMDIYQWLKTDQSEYDVILGPTLLEYWRKGKLEISLSHIDGLRSVARRNEEHRAARRQQRRE